jgi:HEAT repeat protein
VDVTVGASDPDPLVRAASAAAWGLSRGRSAAGATAAVVHLAQSDPDPRVRSTAVGALARRARPTTVVRAWRHAAADSHPAVRRRAAEVAATAAAGLPLEPLLGLLADTDALVAEAAAFALGERAEPAAIAPLCRAATTARDPLVREAAVAALGAIGDPAGFEAVLAACQDKPAIRRRAVLALAAFDDPRVDAALEAAAADRDWQVRQAAEDLQR